MFMSEYNHTLDSKGRLIMPAKFREALGNVVVIGKGVDHCISVYTNEQWERFQEHLKELEEKYFTNKQVRQFTRFMISGASEVELDKQGRILIPQNLRDYAHLDKDVVLAGVGQRIEIWDKARWEGESLDDNIDDILGMLNEMGINLMQ